LGLRFLLQLLIASTDVALVLILVLFEHISVSVAAVLALDELQLFPLLINLLDRLENGLHDLLIAEDRHDVADAFLLASAVLDHQGSAVNRKEACLPIPPVIEHLENQADRGVFQFLWTEEDKLDDQLEVLAKSLDLVLEWLHCGVLLELEDPNHFNDGADHAGQVKVFENVCVPLWLPKNDDDRLQDGIDALQRANAVDRGMASASSVRVAHDHRLIGLAGWR